MNKSFIKYFTYFLLLGIILFNVGTTIYGQHEKYFAQNYWQQLSVLKEYYLESQYVSKNPKGWIPDEIVNAYAGGEYVLGMSPILIAPDTPPLGRYIIGLSGIIFNNANIQNLFFVFGSLGMLYLVSKQVLRNRSLALLPSVFVSFEPFFLNQIIYTPLLDIMQLFFLLCAFYFFNKIFSEKKSIWVWLILANIFLGCFISTKFYATGVTIVAAWLGTLLLLKKIKELVMLLMTLPIAVLVLLGTYIRVLFDGYSIREFLGIQKYVLLYHKSQLIYPFSIWDLLLFNKWHVWFGDKPIISDDQWRLSWPVVTIVGFASLVWVWFKKVPVTLIPLVLWALLYVLFFSVGQIASRYLVILIPVLYVLSIFVVKEMVLLVVKRKKKV